MDSLDIQVVDSLTVNLNQEDYSTEGLVLNSIDVYVEDEQLLFEAALTQDSINLYTRETPDIISFDTKGIMDGISKLEGLIEKTSKEATLTHGVNVISQKIDDIHIPELDKSDLAKEQSLNEGINALSSKIDNIDLSSVENKVDEGVGTLSNKIDNIDTSHLAKESSLNEAKAEIVEAVNNAKPEIDLSGVAQETTLLEVKNAVENIDLASIERKVETESQAIQSAIQNIDLSSVEGKVDEVKQAVENIDLTPIENKVQEGVNTLSSKIDNIDLSAVENKVQEESAAIQRKLDNLNVEVDLTQVAKQGENQEATNSAIYGTLNEIKGDVIDIVKLQLEEVDNLLDI